MAQVVFKKKRQWVLVGKNILNSCLKLRNRSCTSLVASSTRGQTEEAGRTTIPQLQEQKPQPQKVNQNEKPEDMFQVKEQDKIKLKEQLNEVERASFRKKSSE